MFSLARVLRDSLLVLALKEGYGMYMYFILSILMKFSAIQNFAFSKFDFQSYMSSFIVIYIYICLDDLT
jgi:hypothetical protein